MERNKVFRIILAVVFCMVFLVSCGKETSGNPDTSPSPSVTASQEISPTPSPTPSATPTPAPKKEIKWDTDTLKNDSGKTLIKCISDKKDGNNHTSFAIVSSQGTVILADPIYTPGEKGYLKADIITVSHSHSDHYDQMLLNKVKDFSKIASLKPASFTVSDVNVIGVAASHTSAYPIDSNPSNTIFVYELDGLRIAHMGDMGQVELHPEQLEKLGQLDIIFTIITNAPQYGSATEKNIKIIQQLNPKIVIPTHYSDDVLNETIKALGVKEVEKTSELAVSKEDLDTDLMRFIIVE